MYCDRRQFAFDVNVLKFARILPEIIGRIYAQTPAIENPEYNTTNSSNAR